MKSEELQDIELFNTEGEGSVSVLAYQPEEVSSETKDWLDKWSGASLKFRRQNLKFDHWPLNVNGACFKPGFSISPCLRSQALFDHGDEETFTWSEGSSINHLTMNQHSGHYRLLEVRIHWGGRLPFALEVRQTARDAEGRVAVRENTAFKKRREEVFTRLEKELLEEASLERHDGIWLDLVRDDSPHFLIGTIVGPQGSPYSGGRFQIEISLPQSPDLAYPFAVPTFRFITKIWHPNVNHLTGEACLIEVPTSLTLLKLLIHFQVVSSP